MENSILAGEEVNGLNIVEPETIKPWSVLLPAVVTCCNVGVVVFKFVKFEPSPWNEPEKFGADAVL